MLATLLSATLHGITGRVVRVEVDVAPGLPGFTIVGLPDAALSGARERVRGALRNAGFHHPPCRITVNHAPAEVRKPGASLDLAIALGIRPSTGQTPPRRLACSVRSSAFVAVLGAAWWVRHSRARASAGGLVDRAPYHPRGTGESGRQSETRPPDAACINRGNSSESSMARA